MSNIYQSISKKLAVLNIDYYHYEYVLRCYSLAKFNIDHSRCPDYADGIHTAEFDAEASQYQLISSNEKSHYSRYHRVIQYYTAEKDTRPGDNLVTVITRAGVY